MSYLLIWGAGGHAKVLLDVAASQFANMALLDDAAAGPTSLLGRQVFPDIDALMQVRGIPSAFIVGIGNNKARARCFNRALQFGIPPALLVHSSAVVSRYALVSAGSVVMPRAVVNASAQVGRDCIINTASIVEHDCRIGDHVHISPGAITGGGAVVEDFSHIGIGATLLPLARVGTDSVVGAGSVVLRTIPSHVTVAGVPARVLPSREQ
jgi:sugar O-acyltransferase (sialic acid O-acetyltransferase NeuD family)